MDSSQITVRPAGTEQNKVAVITELTIYEEELSILSFPCD